MGLRTLTSSQHVIDPKQVGQRHPRGQQQAQAQSLKGSVTVADQTTGLGGMEFGIKHARTQRRDCLFALGSSRCLQLPSRAPGYVSLQGGTECQGWGIDGRRQLLSERRDVLGGQRRLVSKAQLTVFSCRKGFLRISELRGVWVQGILGFQLQLVSMEREGRIRTSSLGRVGRESEGGLHSQS